MSMEPWLLEQQHTAAMEAALERYPKCDFCGDAITTDTYLRIFGQRMCQDCIQANTEYNTEAFLDDE